MNEIEFNKNREIDVDELGFEIDEEKASKFYEKSSAEARGLY